VCAGIPIGVKYERIADRKQAVAFAIREAKRGDTVVIAGKGHENYQIIGREKVYLDDRELARDALSERLL
jgi:UDP-N-acetylmuramoyl-L-alanyl-D-glutamate--2,6-diaminopimelate ligase